MTITDVLKISKELIQDKKYCNHTYHLANSNYIDTLDLVKIIEKISHRKAKYSPVEKGANYNTIPDDIHNIVSKLGIEFHQNYYEHALKEFYKESKTNSE
jgi:dTDP-4-dehydrorhamnose reductase